MTYEDRVKKEAQELHDIAFNHRDGPHKGYIDSVVLFESFAKHLLFKYSEAIKAGVMGREFFGVNETNIHDHLENEGYKLPKK